MINTKLNRPWAGLFLTGLCWTLFLSLIPFTWVSGWTEYLGQLQQGMNIHFDSQSMGHAAVWILLSICGVLTLKPTSSHRAQLWGLPVLGMGSLVIELLQALVRGRHATLSDLLVAWTASTIAFVVVRLWLRWERGKKTTLPINPGRSIARLFFLILALGATWTISRDFLSEPFDCWDENYPLLLGNEAMESRPWHGHINGIAIYGRALPEDTIVQLGQTPMGTEEGLELRHRLDALVLYPMNEGKGLTIHDHARVENPLHLTIASPNDPQWKTPTGLSFSGNGKVQTTEPTTHLVQDLRQRHQLTMEAVCTSANNQQNGPARILSLSKDPYERNVTLAQVYDMAIVRLRTPGSGPNGMNYLQPGWYGIFQESPKENHFAVTYKNHQLRLFLNGIDQGPRTYYLHDTIHLALERGPGNSVMACFFLLSLALLGWASWRENVTQS